MFSSSNHRNNKFTTKTFALGLLSSFCLMLTCLQSHSAQDGKLDLESQSEIRISLAILPSIQIETDTNINLRISDRSIDANYEKSFCVRGNGSGQGKTKYSITAYGSDESGEFILRNARGEALAYAVSFRGDATQPGYDILASNVASAEYETIDAATPCIDQTAFLISFPANLLQSVDAGLYAGALTLLISPV